MPDIWMTQRMEDSVGIAHFYGARYLTIMTMCRFYHQHRSMGINTSAAL